MNTALKTRAKLSVEQVIEIFQNKGTTATSSAAVVARQYGVSEKTVRDIWKGRTWCGETWHLDTSRVVQTKRIGRPKGCKDSKPRKPKADGRDEASCSPPDHLAGDASAAFDPTSDFEESAECVDRGHTETSSSDTTLTDTRAAASTARPLPAPSGQPHAPAPPPLSSSAAQSVDQQLHEWGRALWLDLESADPFRRDWNPPPAGAPAAAAAAASLPDGSGRHHRGRHHRGRRQARDEPESLSDEAGPSPGGSGGS